jgi:hypothetical protein
VTCGVRWWFGRSVGGGGGVFFRGAVLVELGARSCSQFWCMHPAVVKVAAWCSFHAEVLSSCSSIQSHLSTVVNDQDHFPQQHATNQTALLERSWWKQRTPAWSPSFLVVI